MTRKPLKVALMLGLAILLVLTAGAVMAGAKGSKTALPEYVGSQACLGCHVDEYLKWEPSDHANMVKPLRLASDFPGDPNLASAELRAELDKATWMLADHRFLGKDPVTHELKFLNVQWNRTTKQYVKFNGGANWDKSCSGCHVTGWREDYTYAEAGIGCEACHGPGREHILGKGDISKIAANTDVVTCAQCHTGWGNTPAGTRWPIGYRPGEGMPLTTSGFTWLSWLPTDPVPARRSPGLRQYAEWAASGHAKAVTSLETNSHASDRCYQCHSAEFILEGEKGRAFSVKDHKVYDGITCVACHDPHNSEHSYQLRKDEQSLCISCHTSGLAEGGTYATGATARHAMKEMLYGYGAIGVTPTKGAHSDAKCVDCHMSEANHMMKLIYPSDVFDTPNRKDSCTACHTSSTPFSRDVYLKLWQSSIGDRLTAAAADISMIEARLAVSPNALSAELKDLFRATKTNYTFVNNDKSQGAHNFEYAIKIMSKAGTDLAKIKAGLK